MKAGRIQKAARPHLDCTRCPDHVNSTVNSSDGIQLPLLTPTSALLHVRRGMARLGAARSADRVTYRLCLINNGKFHYEQTPAAVSTK